MQGVTEATSAVLEVIKEYKELEQYYLVGGTGLSIQIDHRLSEDIDLFFYNSYPGEKIKPPRINEIYKKLTKDFKSIKVENSTDMQMRLLVDGVKMDIYSEHRLHRTGDYKMLGKIRLPSVKALIGMKLVSLGFRENWRDMYDLYCLAKYHNDTEFFEGYQMIVSSAYLGSKAKDKKAKTYNGLVTSKLKNIDYIEMVRDESKLEDLKPRYDPSTQDVLDIFKDFGNIEVNANI